MRGDEPDDESDGERSVGDLAPPLELPDTDGQPTHAARRGPARRPRPWSSGPATTAPTRSPGTTGSSTSPATTRTAGCASWPSTPTTPSATRPTRSEAMRERVEREDWPFPYLHDESQEAARAWGARVTPAPVRARLRAAAALRGRPRRRPPGPLAGAPPGCARRSTRCSPGASRRPSTEPGRLLDQVEAEPLSAMTARRRLVRVPASSANLGPGYDVLAAALSLELELEVTETGEFAVDAGARRAAARSLEPLRARVRAPASRRRPALRDPLARSRSPAASARAPRRSSPAWSPPTTCSSSALERDDDLPPRGRARGPPRQRRRRALRRLRALPAPGRWGGAAGRRCGSSRRRASRPCWCSPTRRCRRPRRAPRCRPRSRSTDAVANVAAASQLVLGIERSDLALIARGLADRLHQPARRAPLRALDGAARRRARELGAIGATISGAGPAVMLWCFWQDTGKVVEAATAARAEGWAEVRRVPVQPARRRRAGALTAQAAPR